MLECCGSGEILCDRFNEGSKSAVRMWCVRHCGEILSGRGIYICIENSGEMMPNASNVAVVLGFDEALTVSKQVAAMSRKDRPQLDYVAESE